MANKAKETKTFPGYVLKADEDSGIVEAYVSIMGIIDDDIPPDLIELGAFSKTIRERGPAGIRRIRVLHQHRWDEIIGKPLVMAEHDRSQLPNSVLERYPEATGGLFTQTQFVLDVQRAREDFALLKAEAANEWSIGFDTMDSEWDQDEEGNEFRRIKEIRLWEYSPVTWGANPGTVTTDVKEAVDSRDEDVPLIESTELDKHSEDEAEPVTPLTSDGAAQFKEIKVDQVKIVKRIRVREFLLRWKDE